MPPPITQWFNAFAVNAATGAMTAPMVSGNGMSVVPLTRSNVGDAARNAWKYLRSLRNGIADPEIR